MKILFASSEVAPISQIGGLGNVVRSLPLELYNINVKSRIVIPFTTKINLARYKCRRVREYSFLLDGREEKVVVWRTDYLNSVPVFILDNKRYFHCGQVYRDFKGYSGQARYMFFSKAVCELVKNWDFIPDVIHAHDYFTGIIAIYRNTVYKDDPKISKIGTLLTIHSTRKAQGKAHHSIFDFAGISRKDLPNYSHDRLGEVNLGAQGVYTNDIISTVSPTYAEELLTPQFGFGLTEALKARKKDFYGILNGIDVYEYDPRRRRQIYHPYGISNVFEKKHHNKRELLRSLRLKNRQKNLLVSMVTRLDRQKGLELVFEAMDRIIEMGFTFVLLGQGRIDYVNKLKQFAYNYPEQIYVNFKFDHELAKLIFAGSDLFLMPSVFEPCGLTDMMAMRFGTPPIVRSVGGLKDVVRDGYNGFGFVRYHKEALLSTLKRAYTVNENYHKVKEIGLKRETKWERIVKRAMRRDVSWKKSARQYKTLYNKTINKRNPSY